MTELRRCTQPPDISKKTVKACFEENTKTREFLEKLSDDQWHVVSFDPKNRLVCIDLHSEHNGIHNLTLTLPVISNSTRN